jgi:hypothetical protein
MCACVYSYTFWTLARVEHCDDREATIGASGKCVEKE